MNQVIQVMLWKMRSSQEAAHLVILLQLSMVNVPDLAELSLVVAVLY